MRTRLHIMNSLKISLIPSTMFFFCLLGLASQGAPEPKQDATAVASQPQQKQFDTPKQAADALIQVAGNFDVAAAKEILGPDSDDIITSEDPVMDKNRALAFPAKAKEKRSTAREKRNTDRPNLLAG